MCIRDRYYRFRKYNNKSDKNDTSKERDTTQGTAFTSEALASIFQGSKKVDMWYKDSGATDHKTIIDLNSAYHQIPLTKESRPYTAFCVPWNLYQYTSCLLYTSRCV